MIYYEQLYYFIHGSAMFHHYGEMCLKVPLGFAWERWQNKDLIRLGDGIFKMI